MEFTQELEKFDPTTTKLEAAKAESEQIVAVDLTDSKAVAVVTEKRKELKGMRIEIGKTGKAMREGAKNFSNSVIAKEKELIAIIAPEEERLAEIEDRAKELKLKEERRDVLPKRLERLDAIGDGIGITEDGDTDQDKYQEYLLEMDGPAFEAYFNKRMADKNEADRVELAEKAEAERIAREAKEKEDAEIAEKKAESERLAKEAQEEEAAEKQRIIDDANQKKQDEIDAKAKEVEEKEAAVEAEKLQLAKNEANRVQAEAQKKHDEERAEQEAKDEAERVKRQAEYSEKFDAWTLENNFDEDNDTLEYDSDTVVMWRRVSVLNIEV